MDAFNLGENWFSPTYQGLDQAPIVVMLENLRSGLIWKAFMSDPEMDTMLSKIATRIEIATPAVKGRN